MRDVTDAIRTYVWYIRRRSNRKTRWAAARASFGAAVQALQPGDVCIDCGANIGTITRRLAETGALVHAFEPDPAAFERLTSNTAQYPNVIRHPAAVGPSDGLVKLYRPAGSADAISEGSSLISRKNNICTSSYNTAPQVSINAFVASIGQPIAIMKIDVEGMEIEIIRSLMQANLHGSIRNIFVETHEKQIPSLRHETRKLINDTTSCPNINFDWW